MKWADNNNDNMVCIIFGKIEKKSKNNQVSKNKNLKCKIFQKYKNENLFKNNFYWNI